LADQVVLLNQGKVYSFDSPEDLLKSDVPDVKTFVEQTMGNVYLSSIME